MAKRRSELERAIQSLQAKRDVLDAAIAELKSEQAKKPAVKRTKPAAVEIAKVG